MSVGFLPDYAGSLLGNIDKLTQTARMGQRGDLAGQLTGAVKNLKGIKGTEGVMQDLLSASGMLQNFVSNPTENPLVQAQKAFGVDPMALFSQGGMFGGLGNFGIAQSMGNYGTFGNFPGIGDMSALLGIGGAQAAGLGSLAGLGGLGLESLFGLKGNNGFTNGFNTASALTGTGGGFDVNMLKLIQDAGLSAKDLKGILSNNEINSLSNAGIIKQLPTGVVAKGSTNVLSTEGSGDPHFYANGKLMYDFQGVSGKIFNILSDGQDIGEETFINAKFEGDNGVTVMTEAGLQVAGKKLTIDVKGNVMFEGKPISEAKKEDLEWDTTIPGKEAGTVLRAKVEWDEKAKTLKVNSGEYQINAKIDPGALNFGITTTEAGIAANGDIAGGVQGEMFDPEQQQKIKDFLAGKATYKTGKGAQGEGFLFHKMDNYVVGDLFSTNFGFNRKKVKDEFGKQLDIKTGSN